MCLIALAWRMHPRYSLILAANRDEFHARPTLPLAEWEDAPQVIGGRDALHGGSWLALRGQRLAAVTNVRRPPEQEGRSRGDLVADFVRGDADATAAMRSLANEATRYRPFNLLIHDGDGLAFASNFFHTANPGTASGPGFATRMLEPGIHGVSNGALDAPWPKTAMLMAKLGEWVAASAADLSTDNVPDPEPIFAALADDRLPDTGIGLERERFLSPAFIAHPTYGTRASTVVLIADDGVDIIERRFGPEGSFLEQRQIRTSSRAEPPMPFADMP
jgi:uncharacterized protein with NRDE domain